MYITRETFDVLEKIVRILCQTLDELVYFLHLNIFVSVHVADIQGSMQERAMAAPPLVIREKSGEGHAYKLIRHHAWNSVGVFLGA